MLQIFRRRLSALLVIASLALPLLIVVALWVFVPTLRSPTHGILRKINYDAYLKSEMTVLFSRSSGYSGLQSSGGSTDCIRLGVAGIDPRQNNYLYRNWDYICVVSVDGRYQFAFRPWDTQLLLPFYKLEIEDAVTLVTWEDGFVQLETDRIYPCISRSSLHGASELEITIMSRRTPLSGALQPITIGNGWSNVSGYEQVVKRSIPVAEIP